MLKHSGVTPVAAFWAADGARGGSVAGATSTTLLARLRDQDAASWRRLTQLYGPLVYSWCRKQGLQADDAGDVAQEVFRAVAIRIGQFRRDRPGDSFRRWLKTITANQIRDHWRRKQKEPQAIGGTEAHIRLSEQPEAEVSDPSEEAAEVNHVLRQALELVRADFEEATWKAFWQTAVEGRDMADVAAELGLSANAVRIAKSRVRSRLRQEFGELIEE
jgi:RNA polymerase sigma-70 factor (ECF subfamily)